MLGAFLKPDSLMMGGAGKGARCSIPALSSDWPAVYVPPGLRVYGHVIVEKSQYVVKTGANDDDTFCASKQLLRSIS